MHRWFAPLVLPLVLLCACTTTRQAPPPFDPVNEPTTIGAADEAARQAEAEAAKAVHQSRAIARTAGVLAAIFGGPETESLDQTIDRYRATRDTVLATSAIVGAIHGAREGAKRGFEFDAQFAELRLIDGVDAMRPYPDEIDVHTDGVPDHATVERIVCALNGREPRAVEVQASGDTVFDVREALVGAGLPRTTISTRRNDEMPGVVLVIRYLETGR